KQAGTGIDIRAVYAVTYVIARVPQRHLRACHPGIGSVAPSTTDGTTLTHRPVPIPALNGKAGQPPSCSGSPAKCARSSMARCSSFPGETYQRHSSLGPRFRTPDRILGCRTGAVSPPCHHEKEKGLRQRKRGTVVTPIFQEACS